MLSIVIPVRNDAASLRCTLDHLDALRLRDAIEVIVTACDDVEGTKTAVANRATLIDVMPKAGGVRSVGTARRDVSRLAASRFARKRDRPLGVKVAQ
jgi:glycosyltransferase involved in cell wall biosynthesis